MILDVNFQESVTSFDIKFDEVHNISDGGYERGLEEGEQKGYQKGYDKGSADGYENGYIAGSADGNHNGYTVGYIEGEREGIAVGQKTEYDRFWDNFQKNGERSSYVYAFANASGWNDEIFKPKYKFFTGGNYSFQYMFHNHEGITKITPDFFDLDKSVNYYGVYMFYGAKINTIEYDLRKCTSVGHMFRECKAEEIKLHNLYSGHNTEDNFFRNCTTPVRLRWVNSIAFRNLDISSATLLDAESITQTISILNDSSSGKTVSFSKLAADNAFETFEGLADGSTSAEWLALVATKPNWTISLV